MLFALSTRRAYTALVQLPRTWSTCDEIDRLLEMTTPSILNWSTRFTQIRGGPGDLPLVTSSSLDLVALSLRLLLSAHRLTPSISCCTVCLVSAPMIKYVSCRSIRRVMP